MGITTRAFYEAGRSLAEIRDQRLFQSTHQTFGEYCREGFCLTEVVAFWRVPTPANLYIVADFASILSRSLFGTLVNSLCFSKSMSIISWAKL